MFQNGGIKGNEGAWKLIFLRCIVGISSESLLIKLFVLLITLLLEFNAALRWLDWTFWGGYLPSLSINYVAMSKDMGKRLPQLYYIKMKISYDLGFIAIRVAIAT